MHPKPLPRLAPMMAQSNDHQDEDKDAAALYHRHSHDGEERANHATSAAVVGTGMGPRTMRRQVSVIDMPMIKTGIAGASSNLVNAIVGAGIIGIPYALRESGMVAGVALLIIVSIFTDKSLRMTVDLARYHPMTKQLGVYTFEDLMSIPFGRAGSRFVLASMMILAYGSMVAYLLIVKDSVPTLLGLGHSFVERELVMIVTSVVIMVPLSMRRDISELALTSSLSVVADVLLVLIVCFYAPVNASLQNAGGLCQVIKENSVNGRLFIGLGVLSTAMACQHSAFLIAGTLDQPTPDRWATVTGGSLTTATLLSLLLGVVGYLGFLDQTQGDVLNNFDPASRVVNVGRALLAITMFLTYPMESFVLRHVVVQLFFAGNMDNSTIDPDGKALPEQKRCFGLLGRRESLTLALYLAALAPALVVNDLGPVLSLTGSLGASALAYIAPGLVYLGLNGADFIQRIETLLDQRCLPDPPKNLKTEMGVFDEYPKPWWWFIVGMPIWVSIANAGATGTRQFCIDFVGHEPTELLRNYPAIDDDNDEAGITVGPRRQDYIWSIVLIVFGVMAAVVGVASNIYVHVHDTWIASV